MREKVGVPDNIVKMGKTMVNSTLGKVEQKVRLRKRQDGHSFRSVAIGGPRERGPGPVQGQERRFLNTPEVVAEGKGDR